MGWVFMHPTHNSFPISCGIVLLQHSIQEGYTIMTHYILKSDLVIISGEGLDLDAENDLAQALKEFGINALVVNYPINIQVLRIEESEEDFDDDSEDEDSSLEDAN